MDRWTDGRIRGKQQEPLIGTVLAWVPASRRLIMAKVRKAVGQMWDGGGTVAGM